MTDILKEKEPRNIQNEILLVGCFYKNPDLYVSWGQYIRSKYDFDDEATKFYYDCFELMYKTFAQTIDENKVNLAHKLNKPFYAISPELISDSIFNKNIQQRWKELLQSGVDGICTDKPNEFLSNNLSFP